MLCSNSFCVYMRVNQLAPVMCRLLFRCVNVNEFKIVTEISFKMLYCDTDTQMCLFRISLARLACSCSRYADC